MITWGTMRPKRAHRTPTATRNHLPASMRGQLEKLLNARLADALDLESATKQAHWNVKGPHFIALHELFDQLHRNVQLHVERIAERITALGGTARGTLQAAVRASSLTPYPEDLSDGMQHVRALSERVADFGNKARAAIESAARLGDADTADLFTGVSRDSDNYLWFLEAHLQTKV